MNCVFCEIVAGTEPAEIIREWPDAMAFIPINPVTDGHVLVIPRAHVRDAVENLTVTATTMRAVATDQMRSAVDDHGWMIVG